PIVCLTALACILTVLWIRHAQVASSSWANPHFFHTKIANYFFIEEYYTRDKIFNLLARLPLYVVGPGTILVLIFSKIFTYKSNRGHQGIFKAPNTVVIFGVCFGLFYIFALNGFNTVHNYYQIPIVLPFLFAAFGLV